MTKILLALAAPLLLANAITEADLRQHIEVLASDALEGRAPGTPGGDKAAAYIAGQFHAAGLVSGTAGTLAWYQPVPLVERTPLRSTARFSKGQQAIPVAQTELALRSGEARASIRDARLFFAGHATTADNLDVAGAIVLMLAEPRPGVVGGPSTRDRREALIKKGAVAVIAIAGKDALFETLSAAITRPSAVLAGNTPAPVDGAISIPGAKALFAAAGADFDAAVRAAAEPDYPGQPFDLTGSIDVETAVRRYDSYNVVAKLPGTLNGAGGAIVVSGHWDHLGQCREAGAADRICNGAVDNASGIALMIEVAKQLASGPRLARDVYFVATTAEEMGLLGAVHFAAEPPLPLSSIQAVLNVDTIAIAPKGTPIAIINKGNTGIDPLVERAAKMLGMPIDADDDAKAFIRRQDGWAFGQKGVPFVMAGTGFSDIERLQRYLASDYHQPSDDLAHLPDLGGASDDANLHVALIRELADPRQYNR